eukprot:TRINITY_DN766_c0_g1_i1.p1 TRINITY_DN766_c0_g1~~TRINITY_DN766_c0_g1_i1.p1  ORF type:complete len:313 (-),score=134.55 TRINITY_DN766_c0_g1_i1:182-1084(-)
MINSKQVKNLLKNLNKNNHQKILINLNLNLKKNYSNSKNWPILEEDKRANLQVENEQPIHVFERSNSKKVTLVNGRAFLSPNEMGVKVLKGGLNPEFAPHVYQETAFGPPILSWQKYSAWEEFRNPAVKWPKLKQGSGTRNTRSPALWPSKFSTLHFAIHYGDLLKQYSELNRFKIYWAFIDPVIKEFNARELESIELLNKKDLTDKIDDPNLLSDKKKQKPVEEKISKEDAETLFSEVTMTEEEKELQRQYLKDEKEAKRKEQELKRELARKQMLGTKKRRIAKRKQTRSKSKVGQPKK